VDRHGTQKDLVPKADFGGKLSAGPAVCILGTMLKTGILNPQINSLLSRVRHTNTLVIADRGFPFWPQIETIDITLVDGVPTVLQVLEALLPNFSVGKAWMASEFVAANAAGIGSAYQRLLPPISFETHIEFKRRVPHAIGLIRTGDVTQYGNVILESA
jgi:D-ribose pyranase